MDKAELDYAYLAEYAKVESNKLTAVGASYTYLFTDEVPAVHLLTVAGRIRVPEDYGVVPLSINLIAPEEQYVITFETELQQTKDYHPYAGKVGLVFAITMQIPLASTGLYEVNVDVEGKRARRLAFEVKLTAPAS